MHPAPSVIFFTVFSGVGFGLLTFLGLGTPQVTGWSAFAFFVIAYLCAVGGLVASTFHLGHPERALKAFTQWRSSWLSREGWCAVIALCFMAIYGMGLVFFGSRWGFFGVVGAAFSIATVYTTSMIYTQLESIPRWHSPGTPAMFLSYAAAAGALMAGEANAAIALIAIAAFLQIALWVVGDGALEASGTSLATATGLGTGGAVRAFEPPHTGTNYLLKEFAFVVGRKHSLKLRVISMVLFAVIPIFLLMLPFSHWLMIPVVVSHVAGALVSRWLFFAEAEHVVGLYYGVR